MSDSASHGVWDARASALQSWARARLGPGLEWSTVSADASTRRYFRATRSAVGGRRSHWIGVDAPPQTEDSAAFVRVAGLMADAGLTVPTVHAVDLDEGFMLLSDLGRYRCIDIADAGNVDRLMNAAIDALVAWQCASRPDVLPIYDRPRLRAELDLFVDWYLGVHRSRSLLPDEQRQLDDVLSKIVKQIMRQPQVFVHRDYMLRNLMVWHPLPGVIDFQDALYGPITYDIASLCRDAFISWPEPRVTAWQYRYWHKARAAGLPVAPDWHAFVRDLDYMSVQRHLKVLGIFSRIAHRDGKPGYIDDEARFLGYLAPVVARYPALGPLRDFLPTVPT